MTKDELNAISEGVIGAAVAVHRELGPGLLEHCYKACLDYELTRRGYRVGREIPIPVVYDGVKVDCGFRLDLIVNDAVILELKSVERIDKIHAVQLLTYLKPSCSLT